MNPRSALLVSTLVCVDAVLSAAPSWATEVIGVDVATISWAAATGPVAGYDIFVARGGEDMPRIPELTVHEQSAEIRGAYGESVVVQVAAFDEFGTRGAASEPSDEIHFVETTPPGAPPTETTPIASQSICADFDGDGRDDWLWTNMETGANQMWLTGEAGEVTRFAIPSVDASQWAFGAAGDFDGDGSADLLWWSPADGRTVVWLLDGAELLQEVPLEAVEAGWVPAGVGEFDGDGVADVVWRLDGTEWIEVWRMRGDAAPDSRRLSIRSAKNWSLLWPVDRDGDGRSELLWHRSDTGENRVTYFRSNGRIRNVKLPTAAPGWLSIDAGDFDGDRRADLLWHDPDSGDNWLWFMGRRRVDERAVERAPVGWQPIATGDHDGDGHRDLVWRERNTGMVAVWLMEGDRFLDGIVLDAPVW